MPELPDIERYQRASAVIASIFDPNTTSSTRNEGGICQNCPTSRGTSVPAPSALASFPPVSLCSHSVAWLAVYVKIPSESARSERPYHPALSQVLRVRRLQYETRLYRIRPRPAPARPQTFQDFINIPTIRTQPLQPL